MLNDSGLTDAWVAALEMARGATDGVGLVGYGVAEVRDGDGRSKLLVPFSNLITDAGDLYYANRMVFGLNSNGISAPTAVTGMKLGTSSTVAAKSSTGASLVTYLTGSNVLFDATYPQVANLGAGLGVNAVYRCTWAAGVATSTTLNEVVITNAAGTNSAAEGAAGTISRAVLSSTINKLSTDSLALTWNHKALGA